MDEPGPRVTPRPTHVGAWTSPLSGAPLRRDGPTLCAEDGERWPVVAGIPYLRVGREELVARVLDHLSHDGEGAALAALLADQDDWAPTPPPEEEAIERVLAGGLSLREAMRALAFGPVADYFAYRWSDPTYLAGLALAGAHRPDARRVFELACGIGAHLRALAARGAEGVGADVVFAKLWLARTYVVPDAALVCFDAAAPWPLADAGFDLASCHDALYFLPAKEHVVANLRRLAGEEGTVVVSHTHNAEVGNLSAGEPLTVSQYRALMPDAVCYDDDEATRALLEDRPPQPAAARRRCAAARPSGWSSTPADVHPWRRRSGCR